MLLERNLGKSKLLMLPLVTVKNRMCIKIRVPYLVKMARGIPGAEYSASGQDTETSGLLFTKTGPDYEQ